MFSHVSNFANRIFQNRSARRLRRAIRLFNSGDESSAIVELMKLRETSALSDPLFELIAFALNMGVGSFRRQIFEASVSAISGHVEGYESLGALLRSQKQYVMAERALRGALAIDPQKVEIWNAFGTLLLEMEDYVRAIEVFETGVSVDCSRFELLCNLGIAWELRGDSEKANGFFKRSVALAPNNPNLLANIARAQWDSGAFADAKSTINECLKLDPNNRSGLFMRSHISLSEGNLKTGWEGYEYRIERLLDVSPIVSLPVWRGEESGRAILVTPEQGIGEQLLFAGWLPDLLSRFEYCILVCSDKLKTLFRESFPRAIVMGASEGISLRDLDSLDFQVPIADLGRIFCLTASGINTRTPYLRVRRSEVGVWRQRLAALGPGIKVGISWRGGSAKTGCGLRSIELAQWRPILETPGITFVNLQYSNCRDEIQSIERRFGITIHDFDLSSSNYVETAELISVLDLTISVRTSVVLLCSALNLPVWVLTPVGSSWPYQLESNTSPWLPSARLYRQKRTMMWDEPILRLAKDLNGLVHSLENSRLV